VALDGRENWHNSSVYKSSINYLLHDTNFQYFPDLNVRNFLFLIMFKITSTLNINYIKILTYWGEPMNSQYKNNSSNPLSELINDNTYILLQTKGLINEKSVRDYLIKHKFKELRQNKIRASVAIDLIREEYPYLQFDTIRKIVYQ